MSRLTTSEHIPFSTLRDIYWEQKSYSDGFEEVAIKIYTEQGIYGLAPYLNLNAGMTTSANAAVVFSFLSQKASTDPEAITLFKHALRVNARNNPLDAATLEEGMAEHEHFLETAVITDISASCALPDTSAPAALENGKSEPASPSTQITTPPIRLKDTALGQSSGERQNREEEVAIRGEHCDALRLLVKNCLELRLNKEVDDAIAIATRLKRPAFVAIAELCKKEADPTNVAGATDNHAWTRLRDRLSGTAIEVETSLA